MTLMAEGRQRLMSGACGHGHVDHRDEVLSMRMQMRRISDDPDGTAMPLMLGCQAPALTNRYEAFFF